MSYRSASLLKTASIGLSALMLIATANTGTILAQKAPPTPKPKLTKDTVPPNGPQPLPPLPASNVITAVAGKGAPFNAMGVPGAILNSFGAFDAAGLTVESALDTTQAVSYIGSNGALLQLAIPMKGAATNPVQPNMQTPDDHTPGYIVGGLYQPANGSYVLVATFDPKGQKVQHVRRYSVVSGSLSQNDYAVNIRQIKGKGGQPAPLDTGVVIAEQETCYTLTLQQLCFNPDPGTRDNSIHNTLQNANNTLNHAYNVGVGFDMGHGVPDLIGANYRNNCAASGLSGGACAPNLLVTSANGGDNGKPIALFDVIGANDLPTYDVNGNYVGGLPIGVYTVMNAQPGEGANTPGANGALFLVNANVGQPNYLIPVQAAEGFGGAVVGDSGNQAQAAVKDGMCGGWGW